MGCFIAHGKKSSSNNLEFGPSSTQSSQMLTFSAFVDPTSPSSQGPSTESSNNNELGTFREELGFLNNANQRIHTLPMYHG